jgi:hypothetical protein
MHRAFYVSFVLVPLTIALGFLLFATFSEYWTDLNYTQLRNFNSNQRFSKTGSYRVKKVKFEFPKYTSLFGECDEFKEIDILELVDAPMNQSDSDLSQHLDETARQDEEEQTTDDQQSIEPNSSYRKYVASLPKNTHAEEKEPTALFFKSASCLSKKECESMNNNEEGSCFCCSIRTKSIELNNQLECCYISVYDRHPNDNIANLNSCSLRRLYYSSQYYDNKHECLRHEYNVWSFFKRALKLKEVWQALTLDSNNNNNRSVLVESRSVASNKNIKNDEDFCLRKLFASDNYSVKVFVFRMVTFISFLACIVCSVLCGITLLFVICCNNLGEKRKVLDHSNEYHVPDNTDEYETYENVSKPCCCRCNCLLCPFAFYTFFSLLAFIFCLIGTIVYLFATSYLKNVYLIFDTEYVPERITQTYQHNPWLFNVHQYGMSFYSLLIALALYLVVFIVAICVSCRIQLSSGWRKRYSDSYEVLQMHDVHLNHNHQLANMSNEKRNNSSSKLKNINDKSNVSLSSKKSKKRNSSDDDDNGFLTETHLLTASSGKARLAIAENSYE